MPLKKTVAQFGEQDLIFMLSWGILRLSVCKLCSSHLPGLSDYDINIIMLCYIASLGFQLEHKHHYVLTCTAHWYTSLLDTAGYSAERDADRLPEAWGINKTNSMKRRECKMKKQRILSALLTLCLVFSLVPTALAAGADNFTDVGRDSWCYDYVDYVTSEGYFLGTTNTTFSPDRNMTRAMFVVVLSRFDGLKASNGQSSFTDVEPGSWCAGAVEWAAKNGIVTGYADGTFKPNASITRAQMCAIMDRYVDYYTAEHDVVVAQKGQSGTLTDQYQVPSYAAEAVRNCQKYGLINGYSDGTFRPQANSTRAHVAAIIYRLAFLIDGAKDASKYVVCPNCGELVPISEKKCPECGYTMSGYGNGAQGSNTKPGGGTSTKPTEPDSGEYAYQLTYKDADGTRLHIARKNTDADSYTFPAWSPAEENGLTFVGWSLKPNGDVRYWAGDRIKLTKDRPELTVYAVWDEELDPDDLIGWAVKKTIEDEASTVKYINKINEIGERVDGASAEVTFPFNNGIEIKTEDGNEIKTRPLTLTVNAAVSSDLVADLIETAATTAASLLPDADNSTPSEVKSEIQEIVDAIVAELKEYGIDVSGKTVDEIKDDVYEKLLETGSGLWREYFYKAADAEAEEKTGDQAGGFYTGTVTVSVGDKTATILIDEENTQNQTTLEGCTTRAQQIEKAKEMAKAIADELYADLTGYTSYTSQVTMDSVVTLTFTEPANEIYAAKTENFPYVYPVTLQLNLDGGDLVEYRFADGKGSYVKLHLTEDIQAAYTAAVDEILEAALENESVQKMLADNIVAESGQLQSLIGKMEDPLNITNAEQMVTNTMGDLLLAYFKNDGQGEYDNSAVYTLVDDVAQASVSYVDSYLDANVGETFALGIKKSATPEALMEQLGKMDSFDLGFLEDYPAVEEYVFAVVGDALRVEVGAENPNFTDVYVDAMEAEVDELIADMLEGSYAEYMEDLEQAQAIRSLADMEDVTLGTMLGKLNALDKKVNFTSRLSEEKNDDIVEMIGQLDKLPSNVSIAVNSYELDKEVLKNVLDDVESLADAYEALTTLMARFPNLSLSDFTDPAGVPVIVAYNARTFTFYLVLEID